MVRLVMVGLVLASPSHMLFKSSYCVVLIVVMKYLKQINENIISFASIRDAVVYCFQLHTLILFFRDVGILKHY